MLLTRVLRVHTINDEFENYLKEALPVSKSQHQGSFGFEVDLYTKNTGFTMMIEFMWTVRLIVVFCNAINVKVGKFPCKRNQFKAQIFDKEMQVKYYDMFVHNHIELYETLNGSLSKTYCSGLFS